MKSSDGYWDALAARLTRRRLLATGAAGGALAFMAGCGQNGGAKSGGASTSASPAASTPQPGGVFTYFQLTNPPTLDPQRTTSNATMRPAGAVYSRLFRFKAAHDPQVAESKELENDLGTSAESADGVTWTIKLRPDAKFSNIAPVNGHAVEAEDIRASFTRAVDPKNPNGGSLDMIDENAIETPAKDTVVFKLKYPLAAFPGMLGVALYSWILPREGTSGAFDLSKQMIGSGPYLLDNYTPDVALTFKRNPDWFEKNLGFIDGIRLAVIPDAAQRAAQFSGGNLDQIEVAANDLDTVRRNVPKAELITGSPDSMNRLLGKLGDPTSLWSDQRVRRAFSMAMNRAAIGASVFGGKFQDQALLPLALGKWAVKPADLDSNLAQVYKYDAAQVKQLLEAAGATNFAPKFVYTPDGYAQPYGTLAETANSMLNAVGIKTNLAAVDYNGEYVAGGKGYQAGNFDKNTLVFGAQGGTYTIIDEIMFAYYDSKSRKLPTQLNDPAIDSMVNKARGTLDEGERLKAYQDLQKYLIDRSYYVTGWPWQPTYTLVQPRVQSFSYTQSYGIATESYTKLWLKRS